MVWPAAALPCICEWHSAILQYLRRQKHSTEGGTGGGVLGPPGQEGCVGSVPKLVELYISMATPTTVRVVASTPVCRRHGKGGSHAITVATCFVPHVVSWAAHLWAALRYLLLVGTHVCFWASNSKRSPVLCVGCCVQTSRQQPLVGPCCCTPLRSGLAVLQTRGFLLARVLFLFIRQSQQCMPQPAGEQSCRAGCACRLLRMQAAACWQLRARWLSPQLLERIHVL